MLLALAWPNHQFHSKASQRLSSGTARWATCALTQLGFIRLSSNAAAVTSPRSPAEAAFLLAEMTADSLHTYWDSLPAPALSPFHTAFGHKQVNDAYLLDLARQNDGVLVTFDGRLKSLTVAPEVVEIISASD